MNCEELSAILAGTVSCEVTDLGAKALTHCVYPSSDPVAVYVSKRREGFHVTDGGGAMRSAILHGASWQGAFERACKRFGVEERAGAIVATPPTEEWLYPAIVAVSNASAMAARAALETALGRVERGLRGAIYERLKMAVPESRIARNYEYRGKSGHMWSVDFAVLEDNLVLIKSVVQNGNSINSSYATFGDIGEQRNVANVCVHHQPLAQDSVALIMQVAALVPVDSLTAVTQERAYRRRLH